MPVVLPGAVAAATALVPSPGDPGYDDGALTPVAAVTRGPGRRDSAVMIVTSYDGGHTWPDQLALDASLEPGSWADAIPTPDGVALALVQTDGHVVVWRLAADYLLGRRSVADMSLGTDRRSVATVTR